MSAAREVLGFAHARAHFSSPAMYLPSNCPPGVELGMNRGKELAILPHNYVTHDGSSLGKTHPTLAPSIGLSLTVVNHESKLRAQNLKITPTLNTQKIHRRKTLGSVSALGMVCLNAN